MIQHAIAFATMVFAAAAFPMFAEAEDVAPGQWGAIAGAVNSPSISEVVGQSTASDARTAALSKCQRSFSDSKSCIVQVVKSPNWIAAVAYVHTAAGRAHKVFAIAFGFNQENAINSAKQKALVADPTLVDADLKLVTSICADGNSVPAPQKQAEQ